MTKSPVSLDFFAQLLYPSRLTVRGDATYFIGKRAEMEENRYRSDLYMAQGGQTRRLTSAGDVGMYWLLADGIVFPALREEKDKKAVEKGVPLTVFYKLPYDGGEAIEYLRLGYAVQDAHFLPGGEVIFQATLDHELEALKHQFDGDLDQALEEKKQRDASCTVIDELPFWSNGAGFINKKRNVLYLYDGKDTRLLTDPFAACETLIVDQEGSRALCAMVVYHDKMPFENQLYHISLPDGKLHRIEGLPKGASMYYAFSGQDAIVAFQDADSSYGYSVGNARLYRVPLSGGEAELLEDSGRYNYYNSVGTDVKLGTVDSGLVVADGQVFFTATLASSSHLMALDLASKGIRQVTRQPGMLMEFAKTETGFVILAMRGELPGEMYALSNDGNERALTDLNREVLAGLRLQTPEEFSFTNARGTPIHGWILKPHDFDETKRYPAILDIHGGPKTAFGAVLFHEMQYWCGKGYAVLFCNPTGGDGRGEAFADIRGQYGDVDFDDLMGFVDEALGIYPWIDKGNLGVTGGSYGGFMTNWIIGHTERFRAAASQRSIANWAGFYTTSDIGNLFCTEQMGATPWSNPQKLWQHSPIAYADRVKTPTLFIHSDEDFRCNQFEGISMYYALRDFGVETRLCLFKGENHELSRSGKPKNRIRRLQEITDWMDAHLTQ